MKRRWIIAGVALALAGAGWAAAQWPPLNWIKPTPPFRVADNLYYVGTEGLSAFLVTTPRGHILIDAPMAQNVGKVEASIRALGFRLEDVKVLLNTHAHFDHAAGLAAIKRDTGATLAASEGDRLALETGKYIGSEDVKPLAFSPVKVDRVLKDGDTVTLGGVTLTAVVTPGHSPGCTSWTFPLKVDGEVRRAMIYCSTTVAANRLAPDPQYPGIVGDYRRSFARLRGMTADIFLAPHGDQFDLAAKRARLKPGRANPFVDPGELPAVVARSSAAFEAELARQQGKTP